MDDYRFEEFVADLWAEMGYRTTVRQQSGDGGIDVLARKRGPGGATEAIQAKRYEESTTVGGPDIQQYFAMKYQEGADEGLIVTTGRFTNPAEDRAAELGVGLVDGHDLVRLIDRYASVEFCHRYRDELDIDNNAIAARLADRESRGLRERARRTVTGRRATAEVRLGTALQATGRRLRSARTTLQRAGTRLRGYEPVLRSTQDHDEGASDSTLGAALEAEGTTMVERGFARREAPVVGWRLPVRSIVPLTGVSPSVRAGRSVTDRAAAVAVAVVGLVALLAAANGVWVDSGIASLASHAYLPSAGAALVGIVLATGLYSSSLVETARVAYAVPAAVAVAVQPGPGVGYPQSIGWGLVVGGCLGFVAHTALVRRRRSSPTWAVDYAPVRYTPVFEPTTVYGLTGGVVVAAVLAADGVGVPGASGGVAAAAVACGVCAVVVDTAVRVVRGGIVGTAAGGILLGYVVLGGQLVGVVPPRTAVGSDVVVLLALGAAVAVTVSITGARNRVLRRSMLLVGGGSATLAATAYVVARVTGLPQTRAVVYPEVFGALAVAGSIAFYLAVLAIERRAIAAVASRDAE
ncbi:hypothetical protein GCM10008995_19290 [Halobellus salinus]|uniref:Restriction endonuclease type IV Mrr domain-containing protein n=1 Tax=Halobellus salinus TaxID=931585 RepID=A0A830EH44_9EURY|nr:restriction endonuclease [Halobellus salinus]GGJ09552.1 hypothetical protein GCM10008995_19290 [Halobellus salinus]SMP27525.1 Restriction endonuclease [Halobellus salinus]